MTINFERAQECLDRANYCIDAAETAAERGHKHLEAMWRDFARFWIGRSDDWAGKTKGADLMRAQIEPVYLAIGARIAMLRGTLGITQEDLAKRLRVTRAALANIETGRQRIRVDQVDEIAQAIGTTPRGLMKGIWW